MKNLHLFSPGFRISIIDLVFIFLAVGAAVYIYRISQDTSFVILFTTFHFFMFCNVFRIERKPELIWSIFFCITTYGTLIYQFPPWKYNYLLSLMLAIFLIFIDTKKPSYHGIFWQKINPNLPAWWQSKISKSNNSAN